MLDVTYNYIPAHRNPYERRSIGGDMLHNVSLPLRYEPGGYMTPESGIELGHAIASGHRTVAVVSDWMRSSRMMKEALISGILSHGSDVVDAGCAAEPAAAYAARMCDCSVFVTEGSSSGHISGYRMFNRDGSPFTDEQVRHLTAVHGGPKGQEPAAPGRRMPYGRAVEDYNAYMASVLGNMGGAPVVLDCGCGVVSESAPQILERAGVEVISVNCHHGMDFMPKDPESDADEFGWLHDSISKKEGFIGIGLNRAGSRVTVMDEDGDVIDPSMALALVVRALKPMKVVASMDTSSVIEHAFRDNGIEGSEYLLSSPRLTEVISEMVREDADLAVCRDRIMYRGLPTPDGIRTAAIIASMADSNSLKRTCGSMPTYYRSTASIRLECDEDAFVRALEERARATGRCRFACQEGWRIDMDEGWFLIGYPRDSVVDISAEATDRAYQISLVDTASDLVKSCSHSQ